MSNLARTPTGDVAIPLRRETDLPTLTRQKIVDELQLWQGEWFLNTLEGFPWLQKILSIRNPSLTQARLLLRQALLQTPGVESADVDVSLNKQTSKLDYSFTAYLDDGTVLTGGSGQPFIVTGNAS